MKRKLTGSNIAFYAFMLSALLLVIYFCYRLFISSNKIFSLSFFALLAGLLFESFRIAEKWKHVLSVFIAVFILSIFIFLSGKNGQGYASENQVIGMKFFEYDTIDYYKVDFDEAKIGDLYENQSKSEIDSIKMGIILGDIPNDISDLTFIDKLSNVGYKRSTIEKSKFEHINKIFVEKTTSESSAAACIYVYRDILIFKRRGKIIGTAKICFGCMANQINGTIANAENFGQNGDYEKLEKILRP